MMSVVEKEKIAVMMSVMINVAKDLDVILLANVMSVKQGKIVVLAWVGNALLVNV